MIGSLYEYYSIVGYNGMKVTDLTWEKLVIICVYVQVYACHDTHAGLVDLYFYLHVYSGDGT